MQPHPLFHSPHSISLSLTHTHTRAHTHTRTLCHVLVHTHWSTQTHTRPNVNWSCCLKAAGILPVSLTAACLPHLFAMKSAQVSRAITIINNYLNKVAENRKKLLFCAEYKKQVTGISATFLEIVHSKLNLSYYWLADFSLVVNEVY